MDDLLDSSALDQVFKGGTQPAKPSVPDNVLDGLRQVESSGNRFAVNPDSGAMGPYQFLPATVAALRKQGVNFDPFDEQQSRQAAATYLGQLTQKHGGDIRKALADYGGFVTKDPTQYVNKVLTAGGQKPPTATPAQPNDPNSDVMSSDALDQVFRAGSAPAPAPAKPGIAPTKAQITSPNADLTAHAVSSIVAPVVGGYSGIVSAGKALIQGQGLDKAVDAGVQASQKTTDALTYQPRTEGGQKMSEQWDSGYNPLGWIPNASAWAGRKLGDLLADNGAPGAGAVVAGAGAAAPLAIGLGRPISGLLKPGETPPAVRIEPTMDGAPAAPKPRYRLDSNGNPVLVPQPLPQGAAPVGAQAVVPGASAAPAAPVVPARPTLAQASPEIQSAVSKVQGQGTVPNKDVLARHLDADTLPVPVQLTKGQATMDPALISDEMNSRGKQAPPVPPTFYNAQGKALAANMDAIRSKVAPDIAASNPTEIGQTLVDEYKKMDAPVVADINSKYQALRDANGGQFPIDATALRDNINAALKKELLSHDAPASQLSEINDLAENGGMTFEHFLSLRRNLGNIARTATDGNTRTAAGIMVRQLEELPLEPGAASLKPLADQARAAARARFQRMDSDPAYKAAANDDVGMGEPSTLADKFVQGYIINGKGANVKNMKANLGGSPTANQAIAAAGVDYLTGMAKADKESGKFLADRYASGVRQLGPKLNDIFDPDTAQKVQQIGRVAKYTTVQPKGSYVNNSNSAVTYLADRAKDAAEGIANVKAGGFPLGTLVRRGIGGIAAKKAAAESIAPAAGIDSPSK